MSVLQPGPCAETDPDLFFPSEKTHPKEAVALCRSCEYRVPCLTFALDHGEEGVWGGFTEHARRDVIRQRNRGRSLEDIIAADDAAFYARQERSARLAAAKAERARQYQRARAASLRAQSREERAA